MRPIRPIAIVCSLALFSGCVAPERKPAVRAVASLADTRAALVAGRGQVDEVVKTLGDFEARPEKLEPVYDKYKGQVAAVERRADDVRGRVQDMRLRAADYRASWQQDVAQISDPQLRAAATQRNQRVADRYDAIDRMAQEVRAAYDPFVVGLRDVQTFFASDLTYAGISVAAPKFASVRSTAATLNAKVDALVAELDEASARLSPTTAPMK